MSAVLVVAAVIGLFFLVGLGVGVVVMAALAARRSSAEERPAWPAPTAARGDEPPYPEEIERDDELDEPPWWPGRGAR